MARKSKKQNKVVEEQIIENIDSVVIEEPVTVEKIEKVVDTTCSTINVKEEEIVKEIIEMPKAKEVITETKKIENKKPMLINFNWDWNGQMVD